MAYFNTASTTTLTPPPLYGEAVVQGTPLFGRKESATEVAALDKQLDLSTRNINYINKTNKELDQLGFEWALYANNALKNYNNQDGTKANGWYFGNKGEVQINTQDVWNTLTNSNKDAIIGQYTQFATNPTKFTLAIENTESDGVNPSYFDFQVKYYEYLDKKRHAEALQEKHDEYLREAAASVDGLYQSKGYGPLSYAQLMFDEKTGALVSENEYNNKVTARYNTLKRGLHVYESGPDMYTYARELFRENTSGGNYKSDVILRGKEGDANWNKAINLFNNTILSAYNQSQNISVQGLSLENELDQRFTNFLNTLLESEAFKKYDYGTILPTLSRKVNFENSSEDPLENDILLPREGQEGDLSGRYQNISNTLFNQFLSANGYNINGSNETKNNLLQQKENFRNEMVKSVELLRSNPSDRSVIMSRMNYAQQQMNKIDKELANLNQGPDYQSIYDQLITGKEEQTYNKTYGDIIAMYNKNPGSSFESLENRYQYLVEAGTGGVNFSMGIKYDFNFKEAAAALVKGEQGNANWLAGQSFFKNLNKNLKNNSEDIKNNFLYSFDINPKSEVVSINKSSTSILDGQGNESKYITSVFIPQIASILEKPSNSRKIIEIERFNANKSAKRPGDLSENERNKIPRGEFIYRGQVSGEGMDEYEAYSFKFDPLFLNEYEADLKKIHFKTSEEDEESSNKIITDIFQRVRDNGITFFVKSDYALKNEGFTPSRERKDAMEITGLEGAISDKGYVTRFFNRAGSIKIFKDDAANKWRITGNYLILQNNGTYKKEPIPEKTFPIKAENGTIATPYDISRIMKNYIEQFRYQYNQNTKTIKDLIEAGIDIPDDAYYNCGD